VTSPTYSFANEFVKSVNCTKPGYTSITCSTISNIPYTCIVIFTTKFSDVWVKKDERPSHLKETQALINCLKSVTDVVRDHRVDAYHLYPASH
jgi:hypothetical protein